MFPTKLKDILNRVDEVDPIDYGRSRNFIDGSVTRLSPYISRGVISTRQVADHMLEEGYEPNKISKFLQELAWRDYWQQIWIEKGDLIDKDLRNPQPDVDNYKMPEAVDEATTGIKAIDKAIQEFYETGYMHNHVRMYVASICCNIGKSHWKVPAKWLYYHLKDADWASNGLSWQWVAGANSNKQYVANQENINKYCHTNQRGTFLDVDYSTLTSMDNPERLRSLKLPNLEVNLPESDNAEIEPEKPTLVYTFYNLDPGWKKDIDANRIFLFEPSFYEKYPVSQNTIDFVLELAKNIEDIQIFTGEFDSLKDKAGDSSIFYKEHPTNRHFSGTEEPRDWMFPEVTGYFKSFFQFWKKGVKTTNWKI